MEMDEIYKDLITINTHKGLYPSNPPAFGIAPALAIWQRAIEQVMQGIPKTAFLLDDVDR